MNVGRIVGDRFFTYSGLEREIGDGLTFITGPNGAGKSSVYELVAWVLHGETVRGSKVREAHAEVHFRAAGHAYQVERTRDKRAARVQLRDGGGADLSGATATETQGKIDAIVGTRERFVNSRIFARDLLAKFALATDKERKALIEEFLGLQQFDRALGLAKLDASNLRRQHDAIDARIPLLAEKSQDLRRDVERADAEEDLGALERELAEVAGEHQLGKERRAPLDERVEELVEQLADAGMACVRQALAETNHDAEVERLRGELGAIRDACEACGRPFDAASLVEARHRAQRHLAEMAPPDPAVLRRLKAKRAVLGEELLEVQAQAAAVGLQQTSLRERHAALKARIESARGAAARQADLRARLTAATRELSEQQVQRAALAERIRMSEACVEALGLRGARCLLLGEALGTIEAHANAVLHRISGTIQVRLSGTSQRADGREVDAVSVAVEGAGGGEYRGCSGGQRVRVDVALMLGLAAAQGSDGMLVFDEVFDGLDGEAVERVADYVRELARSRQVLVISHSEAFLAALPGARVLRASADDQGVSHLEGA